MSDDKDKMGIMDTVKNAVGIAEKNRFALMNAVNVSVTWEADDKEIKVSGNNPDNVFKAVRTLEDEQRKGRLFYAERKD